MDLHENLKGKTVVITGGSGILCREFAYAYAKQGMNVAVLGRTLSKLEEVRDKINELGGNGLAVVCDVVDKDSVINAKKVVNDTFGKVDILVNGAGGNHPKGTTTKEYFEKGICIIEWGELILDALPENYIKVKILKDKNEETTRHIQISKN